MFKKIHFKSGRHKTIFIIIIIFIVVVIIMRSKENKKKRRNPYKPSLSKKTMVLGTLQIILNNFKMCYGGRPR